MMQFRPLWVITCAAALLLFNQSAAAKTRIAVLELTAQGVDQADAVAVSERLSAWLAQNPAFEVTAPSRAYVVLKEKGFAKTCNDEDSLCLAEAGETLSADLVIAGIFAKAGASYTILLRVVDAASGRVLITGYQDSNAPVDTILANWTAKAAKQLETVINTRMSNYSVLKIRSEPQGAAVILNGKEVAKTNALLEHTLPGTYALKLQAPNYTPISDKFTVEPQKTVDLSYTLRHTKAYADSVHARSARRVIVRTVVGCVAIAVGAAGYYCNTRAAAAISDERGAKNRYLAADTTSDFTSLYSQYLNAQKKTDNALLERNILYGLSGASALGFVISFFF
jgi:hypothetical protein